MYREMQVPRSSKTSLRCCLTQRFLIPVQKSSEMKLCSFSKCWFGACELLNTGAEPAHSCPAQGTLSEQDSHLGHLTQAFPFLTVLIKSQAQTLAILRAGRVRCWIWAWVPLHSWTRVRDEKSSPLISLITYEKRLHSDNSLP